MIERVTVIKFRMDNGGGISKFTVQVTQYIDNDHMDSCF